MIRAGFLSSVDRKNLIALARDGSAAHRLARRANAPVLLDDDTIRMHKHITHHKCHATCRQLAGIILASLALGLR